MKVRSSLFRILYPLAFLAPLPLFLGGLSGNLLFLRAYGSYFLNHPFPTANPFTFLSTPPPNRLTLLALLLQIPFPVLEIIFATLSIASLVVLSEVLQEKPHLPSFLLSVPFAVPFLGPTPYTLTVFFLTLLFLLLRKTVTGNRPILIPLFFLLWSNLDPASSLGLLLLIVAAFSTHRYLVSTPRGFLILLGAFISPLLTPAGLSLLKGSQSTNLSVASGIFSVGTPNFHLYPILLLLLPLGLLAYLWITTGDPPDRFSRIALTVSVLFFFANQETLPLLFVCIFAFLPLRLPVPTLKVERSLMIVVLGVGILLISLYPVRIKPPVSPLTVAENYLSAAIPAGTRIYATKDFSSELIAHFGTKYPLFETPGIQLSLAQTTASQSLEELGPTWENTLNLYPFQIALLPPNSALATALGLRGWKLVLSSPSFLVLTAPRIK